MRLEQLKEQIDQDPSSGEYVVFFDPDTVTKDEFIAFMRDVQNIYTNDPIVINGTEFTNKVDAISFMKSLIEHRIKRYKEKYEPHQWQHGPYKNSAELVPISWLKRLTGNNLRPTVNNSLGYNPEIDDYDQGTFDDLINSLKKRGLQEPVTIIVGMRDGYAYIGEGNHRIAAASELGWKELPARIIVYNEAQGLRGEGTYSHNVRHDLTWDPETLGSFPQEKYYTKPSQVFKSLRDRK